MLPLAALLQPPSAAALPAKGSSVSISMTPPDAGTVGALPNNLPKLPSLPDPSTVQDDVFESLVNDPSQPRFHYMRPSGSTSHPFPFFDARTNLTHLFYMCSPNSTTA